MDASIQSHNIQYINIKLEVIIIHMKVYEMKRKVTQSEANKVFVCDIAIFQR